MDHMPTATEIYKFIDEFDTQQEYTEFVRSELLLKNSEINDIIADYSSSREQKYQMLSRWQRKNGRNATLAKLVTLKNNFDTRPRGPEENNPETIPGSQGVAGVPAFMNINQRQPENFLEPLTTDIPSSAPANQGTLAPKGTKPSSVAPVESAHKFDPDYTLGKNTRVCDMVASVNVQNCEAKDIKDYRDRADVYPIVNSPKGYVLIINNNFKGQESERNGAEKDVENMKNLWENLGCQVSIREDLPAFDIVEVLKKVADHPRISKFDFVTIFIMSHGELQEIGEVFLGNDGKPVTVAKILRIFDNDKCKGLRGIPKLFFFQFCRGYFIDPGTQSQDDDVEALLHSLKGLFKRLSFDEGDTFTENTNHPIRSDILISYATQSGFKAYRNRGGSWFINAIAHIFMEHARTEHVADLMTKVREAVSRKNGETRAGEGVIVCKEMSETRDLLTKKLYLLPGYPKDDLLDD